MSVGAFAKTMTSGSAPGGSGSSASSPPGVSATVKYWVLFILGLIAAVVSYLAGEPTITWSVIASALLIGIAFAIQSFEGSSS